MKTTPPRMRMFAGPNGSGKSTIKSVISPELLGIYINPDEIERDITKQGFLDFSTFSIEPRPEEILKYFSNSRLLKKEGLLNLIHQFKSQDNKLFFSDISLNSYLASVVADYIRYKLIEDNRSFTFETVMSSPDKIELLRTAQHKGYRTYLYYVATEDPEINLSRIRYRVKMGGHDVPKDKVSSRYDRSLDLLIEAIKFSNRAYIFDNSSQEHIWIAEITNGKILEIKHTLIPNWFKKALLDKLEGDVTSNSIVSE